MLLVVIFQVGDNGIIDLSNSSNPFHPTALPLNGLRFIAPYWADTDLRGTGQVYYRQTKDPVLLARANNEIQRAFPLSQDVTVTNLVIATWDAVGYYNLGTNKVGLCVNTYKLNTSTTVMLM